MSFECIPWNPEWLAATGDSGAPLLDIHAIYRRPSIDRKTFQINRDAHGFIRWDYTGALPVQSHNKWVARGFHYVTLADTASLVAVSNRGIAERGVTPLYQPESYVQNRHTRGPWDAQAYLALAAEVRAAEVAQLLADVAEYGAERAEALRQRDDPGYRIPANLHEAAAQATTRPRGRPRKAEPVEPDPWVPEATA